MGENNRETTLLNIRGEVVKIDNGCVPMVNFFNKIGLDTKYCCEGHKKVSPFYIMFEDYVTDEQIVDFIKPFSNQCNHTPFFGKFVKWCRKMSGEITYNWIYEVQTIGNSKTYADYDYNTMINLYAELEEQELITYKSINIALEDTKNESDKLLEE